MADETTAHIGENSPEQVAYKLMHEVIAAEGYPHQHMSDPTEMREYILQTFAECLEAVRFPGRRSGR